MVARITLAEIDSVRTSVPRAVDLFEDSVVPDLREQPGYEGCYVLTTPEGKALVLTLWTDEDAAEASVAGGSYDARVEKVEKFVTFMRSAPGREMYHVDLVDTP